MTEQPPRPEIDRASSDDVEELVGLRDDIARWMHEVGIEVWNPGEIDTDDVRRWLADGTVYVARDGGGIVAAVVILWEDPAIWGDDDADAGYIHNLMVARSHAHRGLGDVMLSAAEQDVHRHGRDLVRLDAAVSSEFLQRWYADRGYQQVGVRRFDRDDLDDAVLYEKESTGG